MMRFIQFGVAMKRLVLTRSFVFTLLLLPVLLIALAAAFRAPQGEARVYAAVTAEDAADMDYLRELADSEDAFILVSDRAELEAAVSDGSCDCGFVIRSGFSEALERVNLKKTVTVVTTERSVSAPVLGHLLTTRLMDKLVPKQGARLLEREGGTGLSRDELERLTSEEYYVRIEAATGLDFVFQTVEGREIPRDKSLYSAVVPALAAVLLCAFAFLSLRLLSIDGMAEISVRITGRRAFSTVLLPTAAAYITCTAASAFGGLAAAELIYPTGLDRPRLFLSVGVYILTLMGAVLLISAVLRKTAAVTSLLPFVLTAAFVVCPVFMDVTAQYPAVKPFCRLIPPYWLFDMQQGGGACIAVYACCAAVSAALGLAIRFFGSRE